MVVEQTSKRQVAYKVRVADILNNRYVKEEGWLPNYIAVGNWKVSRANLLGVIVSKSSQDDGVVHQDFILDDGSGRLPLRFFESAAQVSVGDIVTVIGRPREFGSDRYIVPEIIKKVSDPKWIEFRRLELAIFANQAMRTAADNMKKNAEVVEDGGLSVETEEFIDDSGPSGGVIDVIRKLDSGSGAGFDEIAAEFKGDAESVVKRLLEQGDIFEVKPGRYKVLE